MIVVGLTGGIGSGKSTVARLLARRGAVIVDADAIVHELQQRGAPLLNELAERFGPEIITDDGVLDRAKLAALAFGDADAVNDLNAIVHPAVRAEFDRRVAANAGTDKVVVLDIPLITERDTYQMAALVVVDAPTEAALQRVLANRAMSADDVRERMARQLSREQRLALADRVIDNSGDRAELERQVDDVWAWMHTLPPQRA
jgi:dephospho-CoA kinase